MATLFRAFTGVGTGGVDQRDHGQPELVGQFHEPHGFAVAFGAGHAEIAFDTGFGVVALFMADHDDRRVVEPCQTAHDRKIIGKVPVPRQRGVFGKKGFNIVFAMGPVGVTCHLTFAPRRQRLVQIVKHLVGFFVQRFGFGAHVHPFGGPRQSAQLFRFAFHFGQWFFEIQILCHHLLRALFRAIWR